jgi:hypothetical protein
MIVLQNPTPAQLFSAKQVRQVLSGGVIQFTDGSEELFTNTGGNTSVATASGPVVPNPGDWILNSRVAFGGQVPSNQGASFGQIVAPTPNGPFLVVPNAAFQTGYSFNYEALTPAQGVVI